MKSEPDVYAFADLVRDGRTAWDGVRNYEARNNLRAMKRGDVLLFYHSNIGLEIVGLAKVVRPAYPDPTTSDDWSAVDVAPVEAFTTPVTLAAVKAHPLLRDMHLVKKSRISVSRVTPEELALVRALGNAPR